MAIGCNSSTCSTISTPEQCDIDPATNIGGDERHALHSHPHRAGVMAGYASMVIGCDSSTCSTISTPEQCDIDRTIRDRKRIVQLQAHPHHNVSWHPIC